RGGRVPDVGPLRGRRALVLGLSAPRCRGRLGSAGADGALQGSPCRAAKAPGRERPAALRNRARPRGHRAYQGARAREATLVARGDAHSAGDESELRLTKSTPADSTSARAPARRG